MESNYKGALWLTIYYTLFTLIPAAIIILLPNDWYFIVLKVVAGLVLLGVVTNFLNHQPLITLIGSAGAGFVLNIVWFSALLLTPWNWARVILAFLVVTTFVTCLNIIKKMQVDPDEELERIVKNSMD